MSSSPMMIGPESGDGRPCGVDDDDVRTMGVDGGGHVVAPYRVARQIERLFVWMTHHHAAGIPAKRRDFVEAADFARLPMDAVGFDQCHAVEVETAVF